MEPSKELVFSYFAGRVTSVQQKVIGEWLTHPDSRERYFQWLDEWERSFPQYTPDPARHLEQLRHRFDHPADGTGTPRYAFPNQAAPGRSVNRWLVAATVGLTLLAGGWLLRDPILYDTIRTGSRQLRSLQLPDGSTITLNSNSMLRVPRIGYGWLSRRVTLTGDAVFDVKHLTNNQPFIVQATNGLAVEVLGTEFSVRSRAIRNEVVLKRGRVSLHYAAADCPAQNLLMKPGDRVTLDQRGRLHLQPQPDSTPFARWRYRLFSFNNTPLPDVARQIRYVFGVTVQLADPALARRTLTGTIRAGSSDELAEALAELLDLRVSHHQQDLVFSTPTETPLPQ